MRGEIHSWYASMTWDVSGLLPGVINACCLCRSAISQSQGEGGERGERIKSRSTVVLGGRDRSIDGPPLQVEEWDDG